MSKKATDIVGYLSPLGFILAFLLGDRENARFHLNQSLVLVVADIILGLLQRVAGWIPLLGILVRILLGCVTFGVFLIWLSAIISAIRGEEKPMPILGGIRLI